MIRKKLKFTSIIIFLIFTIGIIVYLTTPVKRVNIHSELIMLGDLNNDNKWNELDKLILSDFLQNPFSYNRLIALKIDANKNGFIDNEDITILNYLYKNYDPYSALKKASKKNMIFPRPREMFKYIPKSEYIQRPLFLLRNKIIKKSPFSFFNKLNPIKTHNYQNILLAEIYNEIIRFTIAYNKRKESLTNIEKIYVEKKINYCNILYNNKKYYNLLLNLISLVEDAETLSVVNQSPFIKKILYFRDHLRKLLESNLYKNFKNGKVSYKEIFNTIEQLLKKDLNIKIKLSKVKSPRDLSKIKNYIDRAEWQYYKTTSRKKQIRQLLLFAQYDRRYLRAASKTSPKFEDIQLKNHNLPMILLFREALRIKSDNKKGAVGMIDEAIRIPFAWIKLIPRKMLPSSIALENFLLPGNKEDGSDKSRHWNVFGGISLYKSPKESLVLSIKREMSDIKQNNFSTKAMTEFIRDTIANINGIYYIMAINPKLIYKKDR